MKKNTLSRIILMLGVFAMPLVLWGCVQTTIPLATAPPLYEQYKLQSADHWDTVAEGVASRVQKTLEDRPDLIGKPLYIAPPNDGIFTRTFASLLRSRLVSKGMQVSEFHEADAITINYNVQMVLHDSGRGDYGVGLANLGIAVGGVFTGGYTTTSDHEVVINTYMVHRNRYAMSLSQVCYIHDKDWNLYFDPDMLRRKTESADSVWQRYAGRGQAFGSGTIVPPMIERQKSYTPSGGDPLLRSSSQSYQQVEYYSPPPESHYGSGPVTTTYSEPILEEYHMAPGGRRIDPSSTPTPIGRQRR